jgi:hypothetical protein
MLSIEYDLLFIETAPELMIRFGMFFTGLILR